MFDLSSSRSFIHGKPTDGEEGFKDIHAQAVKRTSERKHIVRF